MTQPTDLFAQRDKLPSLKFATPGESHVIVLSAYPSEQQARNFDTQELEFWKDGSPKKIILVQGDVAGAKHALWVTPGTALFAAIAQAQAAAGATIAPGGTLTVSFTHTTPSSKGAHFHPVKQYKASYVPGSAFSKPEATPTTGHMANAATPATPAAPATPGLTPEALAALANLGITLPS